MSRNCLEGYLTPGCANCPDWRYGTEGHGIGCAIRAPIMECPHFRKVYEEDARREDEKRKVDLPDPIYKETANGEIMLVEACDEHSYTKGYYTTDKPEETNPMNIRRVKHIRLPQSVASGRRFSDVHNMFTYLQQTEGYKPFPIQR